MKRKLYHVEETRLESLAEIFRGPARELVRQLNEWCHSLPCQVRVVEGRRSRDEQAARYAIGRRREPDGTWTKVGATVTNAAPGQSAHEWGLAVDIALLSDTRPHPYLGDNEAAWNEIGRRAKSLGLVWGGDFKKLIDKPHVEAANWRALTRPGG